LPEPPRDGEPETPAIRHTGDERALAAEVDTQHGRPWWKGPRNLHPEHFERWPADRLPRGPETDRHGKRYHPRDEQRERRHRQPEPAVEEPARKPPPGASEIGRA